MMKSLAVVAALLGLATASPAAVRNQTRVQAHVEASSSSTSFWYAAMDHTGQYRGYAPHAPSPDSYNVFVAVNAGDGGSLQAAIDSAGSGSRQNEWLASQPRVVYIPPGTYTLSNTLNMRTDTILMGDATNPPVIKAAAGFSGNYLVNGQDPSTGVSGELSPQPVVAVGRPGDVGVAQIQDMRFTVSDVLPGAIVVQFNMAGRNPGDVALWNSLITVGGTRGASALTSACTNPGNECKGAFLGIHITKNSSAYIQNVWNWVADHIAESFGGGSSIAAKGGALVESTKGTWLHGLGSEHWWLYQLNLKSASNVVVSLLQSETNYDQGDNTQQVPPAPWTVDVQGWGDPDFSWCDSTARCHMGLANYVQGGSNIYYFGSASWAFFSGPGYQGCASGGYQCQDYMHVIKTTPSNLQMYGMCSKDTKVALRLGNGTDINAQDGFTGGWSPGGDVGRYTT
ncbi:glycoside hydrolase family 55 protein [Trichoderma longibrachiatum ATCC 18648]|uniref:Glycoside hydrolase family 55 protein n=1 Tax=Trichoderma longibrachiatum ATCC 18648 TaxID=983965 RepID=A0A2T4BSJ8_TRILO|nr:glycoside hydrolase family 55 protein [Trichoderma longibrachiatum ATCC 18648]